MIAKNRITLEFVYTDPLIDDQLKKIHSKS